MRCYRPAQLACYRQMSATPNPSPNPNPNPNTNPNTNPSPNPNPDPDPSPHPYPNPNPNQADERDHTPGGVAAAAGHGWLQSALTKLETEKVLPVLTNPGP